MIYWQQGLNPGKMELENLNISQGIGLDFFSMNGQATDN